MTEISVYQYPKILEYGERMDRKGYESERDLETCVGTCEEEEEEIQLLKDRRARKLIYFLSPYFLGVFWIEYTLVGIQRGLIVALTAMAYFGLADF